MTGRPQRDRKSDGRVSREFIKLNGLRARPEKAASRRHCCLETWRMTRVVTPMYGRSVRCKRFRRSWRCGLASMYPALIGACAPGPRGYQRISDRAGPENRQSGNCPNAGLEATGQLGREEPMELRNGEKLILFMLSEIYERLEIQGQIDPRFVREAIGSGNAWGLSWQYPDIFGTQEANEAVRREVIDFLDMWLLIEFNYKCLSPTDKMRVAEAGPLGRNVQFYGFDANSESEYLNVARFVIDQLNRFSEFRGRTLNAPMPAIRAYRRMYAAFQAMRVLADACSARGQIKIGRLPIRSHAAARSMD
jgi:uncharacterized protein